MVRTCSTVGPENAFRKRIKISHPQMPQYATIAYIKPPSHPNWSVKMTNMACLGPKRVVPLGHSWSQEWDWCLEYPSNQPVPHRQVRVVRFCVSCRRPSLLLPLLLLLLRTSTAGAGWQCSPPDLTVPNVTRERMTAKDTENLIG